MKTVSVRSLQHELRSVLDRVESGETIEVVRRKKSVARIIPVPSASRPEPWPDLIKRLEAIYGAGRTISRSASERLYEDRGGL